MNVRIETLMTAFDGKHVLVRQCKMMSFLCETTLEHSLLQ